MALDTIAIARAEIAQIYIAAFNRVPDAAGLSNWLNQYTAGLMTYAQIAEDFTHQAEYQAKYPALMTNTEYVTEIYQNVFGRTPDAGGLTNWVNQLDHTSITGINRGNIMKLMLDAAGATGNTDGVRLDNQASFAIQSILDGVDTDAATAQLVNITSDAATVTTATAAVAASANVGQTFTLTDGVDVFTGTANNDTFTADNSTATVVTSLADVLNGGAGTDTLTIYGYDNTTDATPQISAIENIVLANSVAGSTISLANATGVTSVTVKDAAGASTTTVADGVTVTLQSNDDATVAQTVNYTATQTSANLVLNAVTTNTTKDVAVNGAAVTTLNIATTGAASTVGNLNVDAAMATVVITGDKNLTITDAVEDAVNTINASAFTGNLSVKFAAPTDAGTVSGMDAADVTITTGSGNDTVDATNFATGKEMAINTGAGDDKVVIVKTATATMAAATSSNAGVVINGGTGTDTLSVDGALSADLTGIVSGFEKLQITAATTMDMNANKLGITDFIIDADTTLNNLSATTTVKIDATGVDLTAALLTAGTADTLTVTLESNTTTGANIIANSHDVINIVSTKSATDAATVVNEMENSSSATSAAALNISGTQDLVIQSMALKAAATVTNTSTGALTSTFSTSIGSYVGSAAADTLSLVAGNLAQGKTFAGGTGTDSLTVAATASQDMGILALTGFETVNLTTSGANAMDMRNVTGLTTLVIDAAVAGTDTLVVSRMDSATTLKFDLTTGDIASVTTTVASGTTQTVNMATAGNDVALLNLDSGVTTLALSFNDGDTTADEDVGTITTITGTSLTTINISGADDATMGTIAATTVTTINASTLTGALSVTASATGTTITGGNDDDSITGGAGVDTIRGGAGADTISGAGGADTYIFEATAATNGIDTLTIVAGSDVLNFTNFMSSIAVAQNGGAGTAITAYTAASVSDVNITNKIALYSDASYNGAATATTIAALIDGAGDAFSLTSGGKAILITGDIAGANDVNQIWYIDDTLDGVSGTVSATDVVSVGVTGAAFDLDTLTTANFTIA